MNTSEIARVNFLSDGKKERHQRIILVALMWCEYPLTGYGIAQRSSLSYNQIMRRTKELESLNLIEQSGKKTDVDGAKRMSYKYIGEACI